MLWSHLARHKYNYEFTCILNSSHRKWIKYYNIIIIALSTTGIFGWKMWDSYPKIVCAIVAFMTLIKSFESHFLPSDKSIEKLDKIALFYAKSFLRLEKILFELDYKKIEEDTAIEQLHEILNSEADLSSLINETIKLDYKKIQDKAKVKADAYFKQVYNV